MGAHLAHKVHQVVKRVAFDVELAVGPRFEQSCQIVHIASADVALVRAGVHGDARSARL